jgi:hypothetical protein
MTNIFLACAIDSTLVFYLLILSNLVSAVHGLKFHKSFDTKTRALLTSPSDLFKRALMLTKVRHLIK